MRKLHFISGLPRSGSTLLAGILRQNPRFHASMSSPVASLVNSALDLVFDTNRLWTARLHQLVELYDDFKMICCVRNPAWIMDCFERIYRANQPHVHAGKPPGGGHRRKLCRQ